MSNIKGQPGYVDMSPKPVAARPMTPRGTVIPPDRQKRMSGKLKSLAKKQAERLVAAAINTPEWMVLTFHMNPDTGAVVLNYKFADFPVNQFEEAAGLFAQVLTEQLGEMFNTPAMIAERKAAADAVKAAQSSEPERAAVKAETRELLNEMHDAEPTGPKFVDELTEFPPGAIPGGPNFPNAEPEHTPEPGK